LTLDHQNILSAVFLGPLLAATLIPAFDADGSRARWAFAAIALFSSGLGFVAMALLNNNKEGGD
jgi:hypothetical protein